MVVRQREMSAHVQRVHEPRDRDGCAALVVRSGTTGTDLAGFASPGTLARHLECPDSPREVRLVWPRHAEAVLIVNHDAAPLARRDSWLRRLDIYDDDAESPYTRMADVLTQLGLERETVGFEHTHRSASRWEEVRGRLPEVRMVECTERMAQVRWIKTSGEIARFKEAADLLDEAYLEVFPTVVAGESDCDYEGRPAAAL